MKKILKLSLLFIIFQYNATAQCLCTLPANSGTILTESYSSVAGWTFNTQVPPSDLSIGGTASYNNITCSTVDLIYRNVPNLSANASAFVAQAKVTLSSGNAPAAYVMALTENTTDPIGGNVGYPITNNDGIFVSIIKKGDAGIFPNPNQPGHEWQFVLQYKDGSALPLPASGNSINMAVSPFTTYYVRLVRIDCRAYMQVSLNSDFTSQLPGSPVCIDIPNTVTGFTTLQHGGISWGNNQRVINMDVDDVLIEPYSSGCTLSSDPTLTFSPVNYCQGDPVTLTVNNATPGSTYLWSTGATTSSIIVNPTSLTIYGVTITAQGGCTEYLSQMLNPNCNPVQFCSYINDQLTGTTRDIGNEIIKTSDGGFALIGTLAKTTSDNDMYFVKFNSNMHPVCSLRLGNLTNQNYQEAGMSLVEASDGFFYIAGTVIIGTNRDVFVAKINTNSQTAPVVWKKRYGGSTTNENATKIIEWNNGTISNLMVIGSCTSVHNPTKMDVMAMKISMDGLSASTMTYTVNGTAQNDYGFDILQISNTECLIIGECDPVDKTVFAFRINANLDLLSYSANRSNTYINLKAKCSALSNGHLYLAGSSKANSSSTEKLTIFEWNLVSNNPFNSTTIESLISNNSEIAYDIIAIANGNLIIAGTSTNSESGTMNNNGLLLEINPSTGSVLWSKTTLQSGFYNNSDEFRSVAEMSSNSYVVTGFTQLNADQEIFYGKFDNLSSATSECCLANYLMNQNANFTCSLVPISAKSYPSILITNHGQQVLQYASDFTCVNYYSNRIAEDEKRNISSNSKVAIYPNPSKGLVNIASEEWILNSTIEIKVFDLSGRIVKSQSIYNINNSEIKLDVSDLNNGIYLIDVNNQAALQTTTKLVINK